jgi:hypothetical protein
MIPLHWRHPRGRRDAGERMSAGRGATRAD